VGLVLSELIADGQTPMPIGIYGIGRFAEGTSDASARHRYDFDESMAAQRPVAQAAGRA
jgi:hypothetical protein